MKIKFIVTIACLVSITTLMSQPNFAWARSIGAASTTLQPNGIAVDNSGNVFTVGSFTGTADFDPGPSTFTMTANGSGGDAYLTKFDLSGNFVWAKQIGASCMELGNAVATDASGNVYITGSFCGGVDFDPGPGTYTMSAMNTDYFVCKFDGSGNFAWASQAVSSGMEYGYGVAVDGSGNVYTIGTFGLNADFDPTPATYTINSNGLTDVFICKYNSSGALQWAGNLGGSGNDYGYAIALDPSGNVLSTGQFSGTADFDPGAGTFTITAAGNNDIFVSKLSSAGAFVWAKAMGGTVNDVGAAIKSDASGNVLSTGSFNGTGDFDPGAGSYTMTSAGSNDCFVSKLDASGNFLWAKQFGASGVDGGGGISTDASGNVYTTGYFSNTVDFDPGPGTFTLSSGGFFDVFINKLDGSGNFSWAVEMGSSGGEMSNGIFVDQNTAIHTVGSFQNTVDFNPGAGVSNLISLSPSDIFVQKLTSCTLTPSQPGAISGATAMCANAGAQVYSISPVGGATGYAWALPGGWTGSSNTNTINATPGSSGVFSVAATNSCGAGAVQTLSVTINALPNVVANGPGTVCSGSIACLSASGAVNYTWTGLCGFFTNSVSPCIPMTAGCTCGYTLTGQGANGCVKTVTYCVNTIPWPTVSVTPKTSTICTGQSLTLTASGVSNYTWMPGGANGNTIVVTPSANAQYLAYGTNSLGCANQDSAFVTVSPCTSIEKNPNSFSSISIYPNPVKNLLMLSRNGAEKSEIILYNSLGDIIYREEWSSEEKKLNVELLSPGIYILQIKNQYGDKVIKLIRE